MAKKAKVQATGKGGGNQGDATKKKSVGNASPDSGKKGKTKKGSDDENSMSAEAKSSPRRIRRNLPGLFWDSTLTKLRIKLNTDKHFNNIVKVPAHPPKMTSYCVRRRNKVSQALQHTYVVARPVTEDMESELWIPNFHDGKNLDQERGIIPYSILGNIKDHSVPTPISVANDYLPSSPAILVKKKKCKHTRRNLKQDHALSFWKDELIKREKIETYLAKITNRPRDELAMGDHANIITFGSASTYEGPLDTWEIGRSTTKTTGFWKQREQLGDELRGIHIALTRKERGFTPELEIVLSTNSGLQQRANTSIPQLDINDGAATQPYILRNKITTFQKKHSNESSKIPIHRNNTSSIQGPALRLAGNTIMWSEENRDMNVELGVTTRPGEAKMGNLTIDNIGTCVIHYHMYKLPIERKFNLYPRSQDKLYVDDSNGIILPNDSSNISVIFRSAYAGIFSETWKIVTTPTLGGDRGITITVWGIAKDADPISALSKDITHQMEENITRHFILDILTDIIGIVCHTPQPSDSKTKDYPNEMRHWFSPILVTNDLFSSLNPGLIYHSGYVSKVINISQLSMPGTKFDRFTLPLNLIRKSMLTMTDLVQYDNAMVPRNDVANILMSYVGELSYSVQEPVSTKMQYICSTLLLDVFNDICDTASRIKKAHRITLDMDFEIEIEKEQLRINAAKSGPKRDIKRKRQSTATPVKDIPPPPPPPPPTGTNKFGRVVKGINKAKKNQYENRARPIMYKLYLEKLNISTYLLIRNMIDKLESYLSD